MKSKLALALALLTGCLLFVFAARLPAAELEDTAATMKPAAPAKTGKASGPARSKEEAKKPDAGKKPKTIAEVVAGNQKFDGLFPLWQDTTNGVVHLLVKKEQLGKEFIYFTFTVDGVAAAGHIRGSYRDNRIFSLHKRFNRIELLSENTAFYFSPTNALHRAAGANISPSVLASLEIVAEDAAKGEYLLKADGIFLSETLHQVKPSPGEGRGGRNFSLGSLSREKTKFLSLKNYPLNTDVTVEYVYENSAPTAGGGDEVTDPRNVSIRMQHSLIQMPANDYQPRFDDPRVGYFSAEITDLTSPSPTPYRDLIHRWHLVKKDKTAALSEPVEPITFWIENTTPVELRDTIRDAALAWNEAFAVAGFTNALVVKVQPDDADWDAGDLRYNVLRWTSSPSPQFGGYGPSFVNPRTGQILGADIMLEYVFVANRVQLERVFPSAALALDDSPAAGAPFGCTLSQQLHQSALFGAESLKAMGVGPIEVTQLMKEAVYYLVLHELGHTLGLNHNMKASQFLSATDIHNRELTERVGLTASVMDYPTANLAPPGVRQGQYFTTRPGPYDQWAIEFGYSPALDDPAAEQQRLEKILARSTEPALAFGNDADDMRSPGGGLDPRVMIFDLSSDAISYSEGRAQLVREVLGKLRERLPVAGDSYHELRNAYLLATTEQANAAAVVSRYIGGVYVDRAKAGQPGGGTPFTPVSRADQQRAMKALRAMLFAPAAFDTPEGLLSHLQMQRRGFNFGNEPEDPKPHARALNVQRAVLNQLLHPRVLARLTDSRLYGNQYSAADFLDELTAAIFDDDLAGDVNPYRQSLQLEYTHRLTGMIGDAGAGRYDYPAQSLALAKLKSIQRQLAGKTAGNAETQAHTAHVLFVIEQALRPKP